MYNGPWMTSTWCEASMNVKGFLLTDWWMCCKVCRLKIHLWPVNWDKSKETFNYLWIISLEDNLSPCERTFTSLSCVCFTQFLSRADSSTCRKDLRKETYYCAQHCDWSNGVTVFNLFFQSKPPVLCYVLLTKIYLYMVPLVWRKRSDVWLQP